MTRKQKRQQRKRRIDLWLKHAHYEPRKSLRQYLFWYWGPYNPATGERPYRSYMNYPELVL